MKLKRLPVTAAIFILALSSYSQEKSSYKFNKVSAEDFSPKVYSIDSNAAAVILADVGSTSFIGNKKGWFSMVFKRHIRARILKNAAIDLATFKIPLYKNDKDEESLDDVKASTYNENNGNIVETILDKHDIFQDKLDKNHTEKKFSMPAVKEGAIIDVVYTIKSDFTFNLQPWTFQHLAYPCLWSEYEVIVPGLLDYMCLKQGVNKYYIEKKSEKSQVYTVSQPTDQTIYGVSSREFSVNTVNTLQRWVMKDLPGFTDIDHLTTPDNYLDKIEFQLYKTFDGETTKDVMNTWPMVTEELMKEDDFGGALTGDNYWLDKDVDNIVSDRTDELGVSKKVYEFVKTNYTCSGNGFLIKTKLSDVFKNKKGNAGEINLILIAMLRKKGITADPVLLSTRNNGRPYDEYPMLAKYNYAFCRAYINNRYYYLDAGHPFLGFGKLDPECYNGHARIINAAAESIDLASDSLKENKNTYIAITSDDKGNLRGSVNKVPGYYESCHLREEISKNGNDNFYNDLKKSFSVETEIKNLKFDSLDVSTEPLGIHYDFVMKPGAANIFYINPLFGEGYEKNIFKSEERILPVEMTFPANRTYILTLEIPKGYIVDEIPKSLTVKLNEKGDGIFQYLIQNSDTYVSLRTTLTLKRTYFSPDEYNNLREFFNLVVKKQNENIVFKKKNL